MVPIQHANPAYQWQINKKLEAALELGFLKDRIHVSAVYYNNRCDNQLIGFPTPVYTGFLTVTANSPALVQNTGWEFTASANVVKTKDFNWSINFNTSINQNKLISYPNFELSPYFGTLVIGRPLNIVKLLHFTGVDPQTGQYTFEDRNKDGQISFDYTDKDDSYAFNNNPKFLVE